MDEFWKKHNRRIGKLLDQRGLSETWKIIDDYIDVDGLPDPASVAAVLAPRLRATMLGEVLEIRADSVRCATTEGTRRGYATRLIVDHLRELKVPDSVLVRWGFPTPYVAMRIYPTDRKTNLEVIGKGRRKKPLLGDVFAYSFDLKRFFWGQVVRDDLDYIGATTLVVLFKSGTESLSQLPAVDSDDLLSGPIAIDAGFWRRGYFVTTTNVPARSGTFDFYGWTPSWNLDRTLSSMHGIPLLALSAET